jgi:hypothetical protein
MQDTEFVQAKDRELTDTQERLGQKQKQIQEMGQQETELVKAKDREITLLK